MRQDEDRNDTALTGSRGDRVLGLFAGVLHHGLACLSPKSAPSNYATVLATAVHYTRYIKDGTVPRRERNETVA